MSTACTATAATTTVRVGKPAPAFDEEAVLENHEFKHIKLSDYAGKYVVLFFYPLDFTFVCPTEILAFSERAADFRKVNCEVIGVSVDSVFSHLAWIKTDRKAGGLGGKLNIPLVSDLKKTMSTQYNVLMDEGFSLRGLFIIDDKGVVRHITHNDPPVGRNVDEVLRLVQAYQYTDKHGEVCPINWTPGSATMVPDPEKSKAYFSAH